MSETPSNNIEEVISNILYQTKDEEWNAFDERDVELVTGRSNYYRANKMYYPAIRKYQEAQDLQFKSQLPVEFTKISEAVINCEERWEIAISIAKIIQDELHLGSPAKGGIVDCRAKSMFTIWEKLRRFDIDPDEIFDTVGVRITARNSESARAMQKKLVESHRLSEAHEFRRLNGKTHQPTIDTLDTPNSRNFAFIRMTLNDDGNPYEVQIQTLDNYVVWRKREKEIFASLAASPKYGLLVDLE